MEEWVESGKQLVMGLLERMGVEAEVEGFIEEGGLYLDIKGDQEGLLIGKHGHTLESLQLLINRMVNKRLKEPVRVFLDVDHYKKRRADSLKKMAHRLGERAKMSGKAITIGPFNSHDRRVIHISLQQDPSLKTESMGEGEMKKIMVIPKKEGGKDRTL